MEPGWKPDEILGLIKAEALEILITEYFNWRDSVRGGTIIHWIVEHGTVDLLRRFLEFKAASNVHLNSCDWTNRSPLYSAVCRRDLAKVAVLLKAGALIECVERNHGHMSCPFKLTLKDENLEMAILLLTAQGRRFPDGHDEGCCKYSLYPHGGSLVAPFFVPSDQVHLSHISRCGAELYERRIRRIDAFYAILFSLECVMTGGNRVVYKQIVVPMLAALWKEYAYAPCWAKKME
jgi:hypothetical protein